MFNIKLVQAIPANPDRIMKYVSQAAEVQGLQVELLYEDEKNFRVVQYTGSDVSAIELEEFAEVKFFKKYWFSDSKYKCGMWLDIREEIARDDWSTMCLINGKYWCHAWAYFDAEYKINFDINRFLILPPSALRIWKGLKISCWLALANSAFRPFLLLAGFLFPLLPHFYNELKSQIIQSILR